jgi:hypothetical protein
MPPLLVTVIGRRGALSMNVVPAIGVTLSDVRVVVLGLALDVEHDAQVALWDVLLRISLDPLPAQRRRRGLPGCPPLVVARVQGGPLAATQLAQ